MKIWKYLGWDTKEARTERNADNNWHATIQRSLLVVCVIVVVAIIYI